jgi:regulator of ribosome biosynthesis
MVFEEDSQEYRPRFGYKRAKNGVEDQPIVEIKTGQDPFKDPWAEERENKKARVVKNEKAQKKNTFRANGGPASLPPQNQKEGFGELKSLIWVMIG